MPTGYIPKFQDRCRSFILIIAPSTLLVWRRTNFPREVIMRVSLRLVLTAIIVTSPSTLAFPILERDQSCTCAPGDPCWPSVESWKRFNATVDGTLIGTVPLAEVCHDEIVENDYICASLKEEWLFAPVQ